MQAAERNSTTPFLKIKDAAKATGLSQYFLRKGCRDGSIPCVMSGPVYRINLPALLRQLGAENDTKANAQLQDAEKAGGLYASGNVKPGCS